MSMTLTGSNGRKYSFDGPYGSVDYIQDRSGVYCIVDHRSDGYHVLDIGESSEPQSRLSNHDRRPCWERKRQGTIKYCICYTPNLQQAGRKEVEQDLRSHYHNLCGDR
jgi:hypothetical protein